MTYRPGFKAEAERIALEVRTELGLSVMDYLNVHALAAHLEIPIVGMSQLADGHAGFLQVFRHQEQDSFSALTLFTGTARIIVHNDSHHPHRQSSNISHEISHCLLEHPPAPLVSAEGCRHWNTQVEAEANWLGAALLVPREGGLCLVKRGWDVGRIAAHYEVSETLCRWRLQQTGILQQVERLARRWGKVRR